MDIVVVLLLLLLVLVVVFLTSISAKTGRLKADHSLSQTTMQRELGTGPIIQGSGFALAVDATGHRVAVITNDGHGRWLPFSCIAAVESKPLYSQEHVQFQEQISS